MEKISNRGSKVWLGALLLMVGIALILKQMDIFFYPHWIFSWQVLLIVIGFFVGFKSKFRGPTWLILVFLGSIFLIEDVFPDFRGHYYLWPVALIIMGAYLVLRPRSKTGEQFGSKNEVLLGEENSREDLLDVTCVFGGINKVVMTKNFKGGDVVSICGGTKINLTQADIQSRAVLEVTQIFGGTKLIIPADWEIKSDMVALFGGIDDKRQPQPGSTPTKVLMIEGVSIFGGIELSSF